MLCPGKQQHRQKPVVLLSYHLSHLRTVVPGLTMAVVMHSSDTLPRATAAPAKTRGFTLLSPLTPKDRCSRADHVCGDAIL